MTTRPPAVATAVAAEHLAVLGCDCAAVDWRIDWAGPVDLPITDETSAQAACGLMAVHGRRYGRPTALPVPFASTAAGLLAAQATLAALIDRHRGGTTRLVTTSVAQAALLTVSQYLAAATTEDDHPEPHAGGGPPFTSLDQVRFEIETFEAEAWQRFWNLLAADPSAVRRGWPPFQQRFATASCPLPPPLHRAARGHPYRLIMSAGARAGVSVVAAGDAPDPAPPWRFTALPGGSGTHRRPAAAPLAGFVVVEATRRLQGPLATHLLRLLGATVIRIEPPGGDPLRGVPPMAGDTSARFQALNRGKRIVEVDLRSTSGRDEARALVSDADVFVHNWAPGKAAAWRLDADDLVKLRPGLVYAYASGWGDALGGEPPIGTDFMVQAHSGLAARLAPPARPATTSLLTLTDVLGGLVCAEAVLAGLLRRLHTGHGQRVDTSLLSAAGVLLRTPPVPHGPSAVPVCASVADLAGDPRFGAALEHGACTFVRPPWSLSS